MENRLDTRQETSLRDFLDVVFRRKWVILGIVVATTVLVVLLDARRPDSWESTSRVLVRRGEQGTVLSQQIRTLPWAEDVASVIQMILSEGVFTRARSAFADSAQAKGFPADWVFNPGSVHASVIGESNVFTISYSDPRPGICELGCNAATEAFAAFYRERNAPQGVNDYIMNQLEDTQTSLEEWREKRNQFMNEKKFFGADDTSRILMNKISALETHLSELNGDISSLELRVANLEALSRRSGPELESELAFSVSAHVLQAGIVQNIKFALQQLNLKKEELTQKYTDQHPEVVAINAQIAGLHADLKLQVENAHRVEKVALEEKQVRREGVLVDIARAREELDRVPDSERTLVAIDAQIDAFQAKEKLLMTRQQEALISEAGSPEQDVSILAHASAPYSKKTRDYVRLALGPLLSIIVGLGIAFFLESMDHSVKSRAEVEEYLDVSVLATVSDTGPGRKSAGGGGG